MSLVEHIARGLLSFTTLRHDHFELIFLVALAERAILACFLLMPSQVRCPVALRRYALLSA